MKYFKILILVFFSFNSLKSSAFEDVNCLKGEFSAQIEKGIDPFGFLQEKLSITKKKCDILIELNKAKYIKNKWHVDICREPVHIKFGGSLQNVVKKSEVNCATAKSEYCEVLSDLKVALEDNGLIYGKGIREDLNSQHGKVYCTYLLLNQYLRNSIVFSYEKPIEVVLSGTTFLNSLNQGNTTLKPIKEHSQQKIDTAQDVLYDF